MTPSARQHFVVFSFNDYGHFNPMFEVARHLLRRGHRVTFVLDEKVRHLVTGLGAELVDYPTTRRALGAGARVDSEEIAEVGLDFLNDSVDVILPRVRAAFADDRPDVVVYDYESFVAGRTIAREWERPSIQFHPYIASNESYSLHAEVFQADSPSVHRGVEAVLDVLERTGVDGDDRWAMMTPFGERNLVLIPREFQPCGDTFDERFEFVGHCVPDPADERGWRRPDSGRPVVLISLGTESNKRAGFFALCADSFADRAWHVVMTLGRGNGAQFAGSAPHIEAHEWLAHADVLPDAAVLVTHGGMGSIMEALYYRRPVVVVPHTPENGVNARRIVELGLGRLVESEDLTSDALRRVVDDVAADRGIRDRVAAFGDAMRAAGGAARAADVLEGSFAVRA